MLTYFYSEVNVEKVSTYRKNNKKRNRIDTGGVLYCIYAIL